MRHTCLQCGSPFLQSAKGRKSDVCGAECREKRRAAVKRGDVASRNGDEGLGPAVPLDGLTDAERQRRRDARIVQAISEGLDAHALCERFGLSEKALLEALSRTGAKRPSRFEWPLGIPG